jgi:hypothetical protein
MNAYIAFLVLIFVMAGFFPKIIRRPWVLVILCILLCLSFYSPRFF